MAALVTMLLVAGLGEPYEGKGLSTGAYAMSSKPIHAALEALRDAERSPDFKTATINMAQAVRVLAQEIEDLQGALKDLRLREETRGQPKGSA